jgi:hypothetical protein
MDTYCYLQAYDMYACDIRRPARRNTYEYIRYAWGMFSGVH